MDAYRRYGPALVRKAERMLGNREDARDAVQGLFVELLGGERDGERLELPYLYRALTNRCLNQLRDGKTRARLLAREEESLRPIRTRHEDAVIGLDLLTKLCGRLDAKVAEVLVYRYVDDLTQEEIATLCGTSRKTVNARLGRIHDEVRALLAEGGR
jgi:RNA polymerase sigma-70 factor (ECF subfamily)